MNSYIAYILGNGPSRNGIQLTDLHPTYGCNAIYRDYWPDWLVAIDSKIIKEIRESDFPMERFIVPDIEEQFEPAEHNPNRPRSNAGMNAMKEAIKHGHSHLVCYGFDFLIRDEKQSTDNIYEGTNAYEGETKATFGDNYNRVKYLKYFCEKNPDVTFTFMFPCNIVNLYNIKLENFNYGWFRCLNT